MLKIGDTQKCYLNVFPIYYHNNKKYTIIHNTYNKIEIHSCLGAIENTKYIHYITITTLYIPCL